MKNLSQFDSDQIDLTPSTLTNDCFGDIKVIDVGPTWMTYEKLMERSATLKSTED